MIQNSATRHTKSEKRTGHTWDKDFIRAVLLTVGIWVAATGYPGMGAYVALAGLVFSGAVNSLIVRAIARARARRAIRQSAPVAVDLGAKNGSHAVEPLS